MSESDLAKRQNGELAKEPQKPSSSEQIVHEVAVERVQRDSFGNEVVERVRYTQVRSK